MTRDFAITLLLIAAVVLLVVMFGQRAPQVSLPLVEAAVPILAPARSVPCAIPPPMPPPVRTT